MKFSSNSLKVDIDRNDSGGTFTNYDVIRGQVTLTVTGSISVSCILVKLQGVATSEMFVPSSRRNSRRKRDPATDNIYLQDVHKVLYDTLVVFPPENVRQVSKAQEFTLTPGTYSYPFEFRIPLNNSCVKLEGITNKVKFSKKRMDFVFNNGGAGTEYLKGRTKGFLLDQMGKKPPAPAYSPTHPNHVNTQLPPSLSGKDGFAGVEYFIKATCKRASILKTNIRALDPFVFLPLDLDSEWQNKNSMGDYEEYREMFIRKEMVFRDRIPDVIGVKMPSEKTKVVSYSRADAIPPKKSLGMKRFFDKGPELPPLPSRGSSSAPVQRKETSALPQIKPTDVSFAFEARFRHPHSLEPSKRPSFKLYLVSNTRPSKYSLAKYDCPEQSNGLGTVYLQRLQILLNSVTTISVLENESSSQKVHRSQNEETITLCDNTYHNLKFDLKNSGVSQSSSVTSSSTAAQYQYELEIPESHFENCTVPAHIAPTFRTCNIARRYDLSIIASFSAEKINNFSNDREIKAKLVRADLHCPNIKILSGLSMTSKLHSASSTSIDSSSRKNSSPSAARKSSYTSQSHSHSDDRPVHQSSSTSLNSSEPDESLPNYNDAVLQSSFQDEHDHRMARRRYQQHERYYQNMN